VLQLSGALGQEMALPLFDSPGLALEVVVEPTGVVGQDRAEDPARVAHLDGRGRDQSAGHGRNVKPSSNLKQV
jgi:hypothetical protein